MSKLNRNHLIGLCIGLAICLGLFMFLAWDATDELGRCATTTERLIQDFRETLDLNDRVLLELDRCLEANEVVIRAVERCGAQTEDIVQSYRQCVEFSEALLTDLQECSQ